MPFKQDEHRLPRPLRIPPEIVQDRVHRGPLDCDIGERMLDPEVLLLRPCAQRIICVIVRLVSARADGRPAFELPQPTPAPLAPPSPSRATKCRGRRRARGAEQWARVRAGSCVLVSRQWGIRTQTSWFGWSVGAWDAESPNLSMLESVLGATHLRVEQSGGVQGDTRWTGEGERR